MNCTENTSWRETKFGKYTCCHYRTKKWCEVDANGVGGVGSKWNSDWTWAEDDDGKTALDACCVCGGDGIKGERYTWHH